MDRYFTSCTWYYEMCLLFNLIVCTLYTITFLFWFQISVDNISMVIRLNVCLDDKILTDIIVCKILMVLEP